jgi:hypothetical protein
MHQFPNMEEAQRLLVQQQPVMMTKPVPSRSTYDDEISSSSSRNVQGAPKVHPRQMELNHSSIWWDQTFMCQLGPVIMVT